MYAAAVARTHSIFLRVSPTARRGAAAGRSGPGPARLGPGPGPDGPQVGLGLVSLAGPGPGPDGRPASAGRGGAWAAARASACPSKILALFYLILQYCIYFVNLSTKILMQLALVLCNIDLCPTNYMEIYCK